MEVGQRPLCVVYLICSRVVHFFSYHDRSVMVQGGSVHPQLEPRSPCTHSTRATRHTPDAHTHATRTHALVVYALACTLTLCIHTINIVAAVAWLRACTSRLSMVFIVVCSGIGGARRSPSLVGIHAGSVATNQSNLRAQSDA